MPPAEVARQNVICPASFDSVCRINARMAPECLHTLPYASLHMTV